MSLQPPLKVFTVEDANRLLPAVRARLIELRATHREILALETKVDIEEMTGGGVGGTPSAPTVARMEEINETIRVRIETYREQVEEFATLGCELKDLEQGLVDFYARLNGQLVYLCWREGEDEIRFWHPLEGGFGAREPL